MSRKRIVVPSAWVAFLLLVIDLSTVIADRSIEESDSWQQLFNGSDLAGWTARSGKAKFKVVDGMIVGTTVPMSPNSFLCTEREYSDFELELEVLCDSELNSGIQVRSQIAEDGTQVTITKNPKKLKTITLPKDRVYGYQIEIAKAESGRSGGVYDEARRFVFLDNLAGKSEAQLAFKNDQWNRIRIRCEGDRIRTWVNDVACADVRDDTDSRGVIGLQVHGDIAVTGRVIKKEYHEYQVRFRNIRIRELSTPFSNSTKNHVTPLPDDYQVAYVPPRAAEDMKSENLASGPALKLADGFRFTEGPAWDGNGSWYFSDIPNKTLYRLSNEGEVKLVRTGEQASNGIVVGSNGELFFCEVAGRRIVARSIDGRETTLADSCDGKPIGMPNDLWMAPNGGIYFTIPVTNKQRAKVVPPEAVNATVCYISPDRKSIRDVGIGLKNANGIVGSSDGKLLYVADPRSQKCWRYSIAADGSLTDQRVAAEQGSDGLALDERGNLYTTSKQGVTVYSPNAKLISTIDVPESPANMKFGGNDGRTLFITARTGIYAVPMQVRGGVSKQPSQKGRR